MEMRALQVFLSVADTLNFSRSSEVLHMSVSAVSRTVQRLEDEVGQTLLERNKRSVSLTREGMSFREYARQAIADWHQVKRQLARDHALAGEISLFCSVTASYRVLSPVLEAFRVTHPAVEIMLHTGDQADGISRVLEGRDDFAVSSLPEQLPDRLSFLPLRKSPVKLCIPRADCAVRAQFTGSNPSFAEFDWSAVPFIIPERGVTNDMVNQWFLAQGFRPQIYAQVAGHEAIVAMVSLGLGVGIAPELVVAASGMVDRVEFVDAAVPLPEISIGLGCLTQRLSNPLVKSLWDVAEQTYRAAV